MILSFLFILFYLAIAFEQAFKMNKAAMALLGAFTCWLFVFISQSQHVPENALLMHLGETSEVVFFLLGAMTLVELMDGYNAFNVLQPLFKSSHPLVLLWILCILCFILSALIDNLSAVLVTLYISKSIFPQSHVRKMLAGLFVIASNAGGVWSPIGDVTTTMLWMGNQISAPVVIKTLFIPAVAALIIPLTVVTIFKTRFMGSEITINISPHKPVSGTEYRIFFLGLFGFCAVPFIKYFFHLPPYLAMFFSLSMVWICTEFMERHSREKQFSVNAALRNIDTPSILFFAGILLMVAALNHSGILQFWAQQLQQYIHSDFSISAIFGLSSAIIDNVPLVAAAQGMFSHTPFYCNHPFWLTLTLATGIGGSTLIIGSAAGVAAMGQEAIGFGWYLKRISILALMGFAAGLLVLYITLF